MPADPASGARLRDTLLLQDVLGEDEWSDLLTGEGWRGLTPLFWQHALPMS